MNPQLKAQWCIVVALLASISAAAAQSQCLRQPTLGQQHKQCPLPVDDSTNTATNAPWTHAPICSNTTAQSRLRSAGDDPERLCVFTSSLFNEHRGLSVIATGETAASMADAAQQHAAAWRHRSHLEGEQGAAAGLAYEVRDVPGKGRGVVAVRDIAQFEVIMVGFPSLVVDGGLISPRGQHRPPPPPPRAAADYGLSPEEEERSALFQLALEQLADRDRTLALAQSMGDDEMHVVEDVIRTNAFGILVNGKGHKALYPEIARINHGCDPNAMGSFKDGTLAMEAVALRDIPAGEEIQLSYIPVGMPSIYRARALANWGFTCSCSMCTAPDRQREESDSRRERIADLLDAMADGGRSGGGGGGGADVARDDDYEGLVNITREFLRLVEAERLTEKLSEYYHDLMGLFYRQGDLASSAEYGRLALRYAEAFGDADDYFCRSLRRVLGVVESQRQAR